MLLLQIQRQFHAFDLTVFTFCSTIAMGVVFLPYVSEEEVRNAWLKLFVTSFPYFLMLFLLYLFCKRYPDYDFFGALKTNLWPILYWPIILYFIFSALLSSLTITKAMEIIVHTYLLPATPTWLVVAIFFISIALAVYYGIITITRFLVLFAIVEIITLTIIVFIGFSEHFEWVYIPPLWSTDLLTFLKSSISDAARYGGVTVLIAYVSYMKKGEAILRPMWIGLALVMIFYVTISIVVLGTFGFDYAIQLLSPILSLVQASSDHTGVLERLDLFFLTIWLLTFYKVLMILLWFAVYLAKRSLPKIHSSRWIIGFLILTYGIYLFTPNYIQLNPLFYDINNLIVSLMLPYTLLLFLLFKKGKVQSN